jgi:Sulfotransferase domain
MRMDQPTDRASGEHDHWFFILGCQRSGTTLLRLILECHPDVQCCDEWMAYHVLASRLEVTRERPLVGFKVPRLTEQFGNAAFTEIAGTPVPNLYLGRPLIFMVRDVRDVVASMLKLRINGMTWLDRWGKPVLESKVANDAAFCERYGPAFEALGHSRFPHVGAAGLYWRYKVEALFDYLRTGRQVLMVRYEDLVHRPAVELVRVCGFLGIRWEPALLDHPQFPHGELMRDGMAIGNTNPQRGIDDSSVGQWRSTFREEEISEILRFAGPAQATLYTPNEAPMNEPMRRVPAPEVNAASR